MQFVSKYMVTHRELFPWSNDGVCGLLSGFIWLCLNTIVLALVLSSIDYYFQLSSSVTLERILRINVVVAASGLMIIRTISIVLHTPLTSMIFSKILSERNYLRNAGLFALFVGACFVFYLKYNYINEFNLVFNYPSVIFVIDIYLMLSLRAYLSSYGVSCR